MDEAARSPRRRAGGGLNVGWAFDSPGAAVDALCERIAPVVSERVELDRAIGRVLAVDVRADRPSPACDVSAMDGFAVRAGELARGALPVAGTIRIGREPPVLPPGAALRIVTGAPLPPGADAVIRREDVREREGAIELEPHARAPHAGQDVRREGENGAAGVLVAGAGRVIDAAAACAIASVEAPLVEVRRALRVALLVTGDEVVDPGGIASRWQVRDANGPAVRALLARPWLELVAVPRVPDDEAATRAAITRALEDCDALVLTGGVSMGDRDHVPDALRACGVEVLFHKLPQRPGKPVLGGIAPGGRPVLALPGNPVSVMVTARRIALPSLARRAGLVRTLPERRVELESPAKDAPIALWWHRPVALDAGGRARLLEGRGSGDVVSIAGSDGFVEIPPGVAGAGPHVFYGWGG